MICRFHAEHIQLERAETTPIEYMYESRKNLAEKLVSE